MKLNIITTLVIVLLLMSNSCKFIEEKGWFGKSRVDTMVVWQAKQDSIRAVDSIRKEVEAMKAIEQARLDSIQKVDQELLAWEARFKYHIIVGSFLTPQYADDYKLFYNLQGYDAKILDGPKNRFKLVSAEVHDNLNKALSRLIQFQDTVDFESWLYIKD